MIHPHVDMLDVFAKLEPERYPKAGTPNADVHLGVVSAKGGPTRWMDLGEPHGQLVARINWLPDSSAVAGQRLNRGQNRLQLGAPKCRTGGTQARPTETAAPASPPSLHLP